MAISVAGLPKYGSVIVFRSTMSSVPQKVAAVGGLIVLVRVEQSGPVGVPFPATYRVEPFNRA